MLGPLVKTAQAIITFLIDVNLLTVPCNDLIFLKNFDVY